MHDRTTGASVYILGSLVRRVGDVGDAYATQNPYMNTTPMS